MNILKKEVVYTIPYTTSEDIEKANDLRSDLYDKYNSVQVYQNGINEVRIVASDEIKETVS